MIWNIITDFGDSAAMLPAAVLLAAWLVVDGQWRPAMLWGGLFATQAAVVAATKIAFRGWGIGLEALDFTGISGHSALACSVIPIGFALATQRAGSAVRLGAVALGWSVGLIVGLSRLALAQHSWSEVLAGCLLGGGVSLLFVGLTSLRDSSRRHPATRLPAPMVAGVIAVVVLLMHGTRAPSDRLITKIALHLSGHTTPYTRYYVRDPWSGAFWLHDPWHRRMLGAAVDDGSASPAQACVQAACAIIAPSRQTSRGRTT